MLSSFKKECKKVGNRNFTFVKVRKTRVCSHCLRGIMAGTECLTINPRRSSRRWYCDDCVKAFLQVGYAKKSYERIAFGDEGGAIACLEWIAEAEAELNYRRK